MPSKFVIVDVETTGLDSTASVCQLSYIVFINGEVNSGKNFFFAVDEMPAAAEAVHGLSKELLDTLSNGNTFSNVVEEIVEDFKDAVFVAHNAEFDYNMISREFVRIGVSLPKMPIFCTMKVLTPIMKLPRSKSSGNKFPGLEEAISYYNISEKPINYLLNIVFNTANVAHHDARYDVIATACVVYIGGLIPSILTLCSS